MLSCLLLYCSMKPLNFHRFLPGSILCLLVWHRPPCFVHKSLTFFVQSLDALRSLLGRLPNTTWCSVAEKLCGHYLGSNHCGVQVPQVGAVQHYRGDKGLWSPLGKPKRTHRIYKHISPEIFVYHVRKHKGTVRCVFTGKGDFFVSIYIDIIEFKARSRIYFEVNILINCPLTLYPLNKFCHSFNVHRLLYL